MAVTTSWDLVAAGVLFDMDGTLVDSTVVVEAMWGAFALAHGLDRDVLIPASHGRQTIDTIRDFLPELDPAEQERLEQEFTAEEVVRTDGIVEIPGAAALVRRLIDASAPTAVVTSATRELATARMLAAGVPVPEVMITPEDITRGKPDPEGYLHAAARLGVPIQECVVFEDAPAGLSAAVASGGRVVVVGGHESEATVGLARVPDFTGVHVRRIGDRVHLFLDEPRS